MSNPRSRKLTVVLVAGALTMFGTAGALAAEGGGAPAPSARPADHGDDHGGGANPLCSGTPLSGTPLCASPGEQPPEDGGGGDAG